jgi:hypothetical protein
MPSIRVGVPWVVDVAGPAQPRAVAPCLDPHAQAIRSREVILADGAPAPGTVSKLPGFADACPYPI